MANSHPQMSPPPFSPSAMSPNPMSPPSSNQYPPSKRPRLSPAASPHASPQLANGQLPNLSFSPQYEGASNGIFGGSQYEMPNTPTAGSMGPPSRPVEEKAPGIDDLSDVLFGSGIDIREEETALQGRSTRPTTGTLFNTQSTLFGSTFEGSQQSFPEGFTIPQFSKNLPGRRDSFYGAGTFNQAPISPDFVHQQVDEAKRERIRAFNIRKQFELNDPFLQSRAVWHKLQRESQLAQTRLPAQGGGLPQQSTWRRDVFTVGSPQNHAIRPLGETQTAISSDGVVADALTLISLATRERLRTLIEDAGGVARGRRETAHGVVPPDLVDVSIGIGKTTETTFEDSGKTNPLKRSYSEANALPSPVSDDQTQIKHIKTIAYPNTLAISVTKHQDSYQKLEEARSERRSKRKASGVMAGEQSLAGSSAGTPVPGTPVPGDMAPKISKKEQKKQADARANEAQQHLNTNNAVNLALGGNLVFGKKKKISWMTSKQPATDSFAMAKAAQQAPGGSKGGVTASEGIGNFREDKETGRGIQLWDLLHILEPDMREKKSLAKAYTRMRSTR